MPTKIYILLRFYLRVDRIKVKVYDTRIYYEVMCPRLRCDFNQNFQFINLDLFQIQSMTTIK
jgi:hypothetical protein